MRKSTDKSHWIAPNQYSSYRTKTQVSYQPTLVAITRLLIGTLTKKMDEFNEIYPIGND